MFHLFLFLGLLSIKIHEVTSSCTAKRDGSQFQSCRHSYCNNYYTADIECLNIELKDDYLTVHADSDSYFRNITFKNSVISIIPNSLFTKYKTVENLYINHSHVKTIKSSAFHELADLNTLYLQDNSITSFKSGTFEDLKSLTILNISNNHLTSLYDDIFEDLTKLKILDISYNNLTTISTKLFANTEYLSQLYLNHNNIDIKHENIFRNLDNIKLIDLSNNHLHNFSSLFSGTVLTSLVTLKVDNNMISFKENNTFMEITNVKILTLSHNKIYVNIEFSGTVTYLDVSFTMLPLSVSSFESCTNLNELLLNNNNISIIDVDLFASLNKLQNLQLQFNNIQNIPTGSFGTLHHLQILNLSFNNLDHINIGSISGLENLEILNLANNQLLNIEISEFFSLNYIKILNLDNNLLSTLDVTNLILHMHRNVSKPTIITLHNNRWKCDWLPKAVGLLQKNNFIVLRGNSIKVKNFKSIACIDTTGNINSVPSISTNKMQTSTKSTPRPTRKTTINNTPTTKKTSIFPGLISSRPTPKSSSKIFTTNTTPTVKKPEPNQTDIDYKYFSSFKASETKDKSEEIWQVVSEIRGFQIFIIIVIITVFFYFIQMKVVKNFKKNMVVNNEIYSQSCNIELINPNNE